MSCKASIFKLVLWIFIINLISSSAYTASEGIEKYDKVNMDYVLSYDGKVQQNGPGFEAKISPNDLILGFYEGLLGMKVGDDKQIIVPPEKGYTQPGHELYGKTLYFDVHINSIVSNVRGNDYSESTSQTTSVAETNIGGSSNNVSFIGNLFGSPIFQGVVGILAVAVVYIKSIK